MDTTNAADRRRIQVMTIDEFEAEALHLAPVTRARLAAKLLESLETLSDEEDLLLWARRPSAEIMCATLPRRRT